MIRVYIVEESARARLELEELLRGAGIGIRSSAANIAELEDLAQDDLAAGVIVTSAAPAQLGAIAEQSTESDLFSGAPIVVFADPSDSSYNTATAFRMGARSVLSTELSHAQIVAALEAVSQGFVVSIPVANSVFSTVRPPTESAQLVEPLTARELEVLWLLAVGLPNKQIAAQLKISDHTVKFHVAAILGKLGATSRTEAVAIGIRNGLILL
jgi:DNA-binding NarL/FixJ family response regulator